LAVPVKLLVSVVDEQLSEAEANGTTTTPKQFVPVKTCEIFAGH